MRVIGTLLIFSIALSNYAFSGGNVPTSTDEEKIPDPAMSQLAKGAPKIEEVSKYFCDYHHSKDLHDFYNAYCLMRSDIPLLKERAPLEKKLRELVREREKIVGKIENVSIISGMSCLITIGGLSGYYESLPLLAVGVYSFPVVGFGALVVGLACSKKIQGNSDKLKDLRHIMEGINCSIATSGDFLEELSHKFNISLVDLSDENIKRLKSEIIRELGFNRYEHSEEVGELSVSEEECMIVVEV